MTVLWIIFFSLLGSVGAIVAATGFLLLRDKTQQKLVPHLVSYATGTLLTAAFLGLMPHALKSLSSQAALSTILVGIFVFFLLEKLVV